MGNSSQVFLTTFKKEFLTAAGASDSLVFKVEMKDSISEMREVSNMDGVRFLESEGGA